MRALWQRRGGTFHSGRKFQEVLVVNLQEKDEKRSIPDKQESKCKVDSREKLQVTQSGRSIWSKRQQNGG